MAAHTQRLFYLDAARCLAIALVTVYHLWRYFGEPALYVIGVPVHRIAAMGYVGVDLFFVVSGFAMMLTWTGAKGTWRERARRFYIARFTRIVPPYVVAVFAWCIAISLGINPRPAGLPDVFTHLSFTHTLHPSTFFSISGVLWSLAVEVQFYAMFPILARFEPGKYFAALSVAACITIDEIAPASGPMAYVARWNIATFLPLFLLGGWIHLNQPRFKPSYRIAFFLIVTAIAIAVADSPDSLELAPRIATGAALGVALLLFAPRLEPKGVIPRAIATIGTASYSIYLYNYAYVWSQPPLLQGWIGFALYFAWVMLFGLCAWWLVERPVETMRRRLLRKTPRPSLSAQTQE